jgi:hypothetical protein
MPCSPCTPLTHPQTRRAGHRAHPSRFRTQGRPDGVVPRPRQSVLQAHHLQGAQGEGRPAALLLGLLRWVDGSTRHHITSHRRNHRIASHDMSPYRRTSCQSSESVGPLSTRSQPTTCRSGSRTRSRSTARRTRGCSWYRMDCTWRSPPVCALHGTSH